MEKRGQAALFLILGIIILALALTLIIGQHVAFEEDEVAERKTLSSIPAELEPLRQYIQKCIYDVSLLALKKSAAQGGYIVPLEHGMEASIVDSTEGSMLRFSKNADLMVPYWYYLESSNNCRENCRFYSRRPPLYGDMPSSVETQVSRYVEDNMAKCLNDFESLRKSGFELTQEGLMDAEVTLAENDVSVYINYPIDVVKGGVSMHVDDYQAVIEVPYKKMYDYASLISASAEEYHFLERHTLELISIYSGLDKNKLPPTGATTFEFTSTLFWLRSKVKEQLKTLFMSYVPGLQVLNSKNYRPYEYNKKGPARKAVQRIFDNMVLPLEQEGYDSLAVTFEYLGWPFYFDINSKGEMIRPDSLSMDFLPFFGVQKFNNMYDVSFPVKISIRDEDALFGKGFTFNFALEANIRNNEEMVPEFNQSRYEPDVSFDGSFFCEPRHMNSGNISLEILDGATMKPVKEAQVMYSCGDLSCAVAITDSEGKIESKFPICSGGFFTLLKENYVAKYYSLSTKLGEDKDVGTFVFEPLRERKVVINKRPIVKVGKEWQFVPEQTRDMSPYEVAIITLTQVPAVPGTEGETFVTMIQSSGPNDISTLRLIPGIYEANIDILSEKTLTIDPDKRTRKGETYYIPEETMEIDSYLSGGLRTNRKVGYLVIDKKALDSTDTIIFNVIGIDLEGISDLKIEDLTQITNMEEYSQRYYEFLKPQFGTTNWKKD
jgi:hypothetical protein